MKTSFLRLRLSLSILALACCTLFITLGLTVTTSAPLSIDTYAATWAGNALPLAWVATNTGLFPELASIGVMALVFGYLHRAWLGRAIFAVVIDVEAWLISDACKHIFHRARPPHWFYHQETSFSYPSGHAMHAFVVYGLWAFFLWTSSLPRMFRIWATSILTTWAFVISWSRLALGVHYATDIIGGWLLAVTILSIGFALFPQMLRKPQSRNSETAGTR